MFKFGNCGKIHTTNHQFCTNTFFPSVGGSLKALILQVSLTLKLGSCRSLCVDSSTFDIPVTRLALAQSNFTDKSPSLLFSPPWSTVVPA